MKQRGSVYGSRILNEMPRVEGKRIFPLAKVCKIAQSFCDELCRTAATEIDPVPLTSRSS